MDKIDLIPGHSTYIQSDEDQCPVCGHTFNVATIEGDQRGPGPGDTSICFKCASYLVFGEDLKVHLMTEEELIDLDNQLLIELQQHRKQIQEFREWLANQNKL